jgi:FtsP/CotA-like multicopper oxidase with cupredoxin domain
MTPGRPLVEPADLSTPTQRTARLRLVAEPKLFDISGKKVWGESYDGDYVGPTLHFYPGEHVDLTLVNKLRTATNLHFHGLHVSPSGSADNTYISVSPGHSFTYHVDIPLDQPQGTFWYHDHDMCTGDATMSMPGMSSMAAPAPDCQDIETQIYDGLSGTIIMGDDRSVLPSALSRVTTRTLVLKDMQITASGHIAANTANYSISSSNPTVRLVNGQLRPVLTMRPGQTELWRIANEGADIFYDLRLPGYRFTVVGQDGYPVAKVSTAGTLVLPPAKRWDVLVTASTHPGIAWLDTLKINNGPQGDTYPLTRLMEVRVAGQAEPSLPMPAGALPTASPSLASAHIVAKRVVRLSENAAGTVMYINGRQFNPSKSIFSTPAILGTTEQWTVINETGEIHPFHLHTEHFQVMSVNGITLPYAGEQDIIPVPYKQRGKPGVVVIRVRFTDFPGKVMFHCHIAAHEDAGMMSFVNVIGPGDQVNVRPPG